MGFFYFKTLTVVAQETPEKRGLMQQNTSSCTEVFSSSKDFRSYSASTSVKKHLAIKLDGGRTKLFLKKRPTRLPEPEKVPAARQPAHCPADGRVPRLGICHGPGRTDP